jgi:tetratricopeptide (TPR) repeat protein
VAIVVFLGAGWIIYQTNVQVILASVYHQDAQRAFQQRHYDRAATAYRKAMAYDPVQELYPLEYAQLLATKAHYRTPESAAREQLFSEAEQVLQDAIAHNPYEQYHPAALGEVYRLWAKTLPAGTRRTQRYHKAAATYDVALAINSENVLLWRQAAALYEEMGDADRVRDAYEHLLTWDSTNSGLSQRLANLYRAANNTPRAAELYEQTLRHADHPLPAAHHALASLYAQMDRLDEAIRESERAVNLDASTPAYHYLLIRLYLREDRCSQALEHTRAALQRWPNDNTLHIRRQEVIQQCPAAADPD